MIAWEDSSPKRSKCVEWDVKPFSTQLNSAQLMSFLYLSVFNLNVAGGVQSVGRARGRPVLWLTRSQPSSEHLRLRLWEPIGPTAAPAGARLSVHAVSQRARHVQLQELSFSRAEEQGGNWASGRLEHGHSEQLYPGGKCHPVMGIELNFTCYVRSRQTCSSGLVTVAANASVGTVDIDARLNTLLEVFGCGWYCWQAPLWWWWWWWLITTKITTIMVICEKHTVAALHQGADWLIE